MKEETLFRKLANMVKVTDIYTPALTTFNINDSISIVNETWSVDLCMEKNLDPGAQIALVSDNNKIVGWLAFDDLLAGKKVNEVMNVITTNLIISSDATLLQTIEAFNATNNNYFLVLHAKDIIGWVISSDLYKSPVKICLMSMLLNLERLFINAIMASKENWVEIISNERLEKAKKIYNLRGYTINGSKISKGKLLECTTFIDKVTICKKVLSIREKVSGIDNKKMLILAEKIRNEIAHPLATDECSDFLSIEKIYPFIQWCEETEKRLENYCYEKKR